VASIEGRTATVDGVVLTHVGGPTVLIEVGGWRLLTDPTFDPPGRRYGFGWGASSRKTVGPALSVDQLGDVDVVLLSHDHHGDNLDHAGRALLPRAETVLTTRPGSRRLGGNAHGLAAWETTTLHAEGKADLDVTATPCRHGPRFSRPVAGAVTGFALRWAGQRHGALWVTGDTVLYAAVRQVADRMPVDLMLLHLGAVRFPVTGPVRYTMTASEGVELARLVNARTVVPVHYEGWGHFHEGRDRIDAALVHAPDVAHRVSWLTPGIPAEPGCDPRYQ
jgi:L-ascorbate metabolism protein UlaG (beta-lactamase superfamily)